MTTHPASGGSSPNTTRMRGPAVLDDGSTDPRRLGLDTKPFDSSLNRVHTHLEQGPVFHSLDVSSPLTTEMKGQAVLNDGSMKSRRIGLEIKPSIHPSFRIQVRLDRMAGCRTTSDFSSVTARGRVNWRAPHPVLNVSLLNVS